MTRPKLCPVCAAPAHGVGCKRRPKFSDAGQIGRTAPRRARGLDALIPTSPQLAPSDVRKVQWAQLEAALFAITNAQFEYEHNRDDDAGATWIGDARAALGTLALLLSEGPDAEGYARLFAEIMAAPTSGGKR